jgi:hypothetical protein
MKNSCILPVFAVVSLLFTWSGPVFAEKTGGGLSGDDPPPELWFPVGEEIDYAVFWGIFMVGEATTKAEWVQQEGRRLLSISMRAQSNGVVEKLYPVQEVMTTILDPATFLPLSFEKDSHEGRRHAHEITTFDHAAKKGYWKSLLKDKQKEFDIDADTRDMMGLMYWVRKDPIRAGETRNFRMMADEKVYDVIVAAGKQEPVSLENYGKIPCIKMEPKGKFNGMFVRKGRMWLWVSDDPRYAICRIVASVPVASIKIMLKKVRGPGNDFWTQATEKK